MNHLDKLARAALFAAVLALGGCASVTPARPLYYWGSFPEMQYRSLMQTGANPADQITGMEMMSEKARAAGVALPPGFRAHLGMLKISVGDASQARQLWQGEKDAFPESAPYMDRLLQRVAAPNKAKPT